MPKIPFLRHFQQYALEGYAKKKYFQDLGVSDMLPTSAKDIRKSFLTILGTFWTLLRDIEAILKKFPQPPLKKKFPELSESLQFQTKQIK